REGRRARGDRIGAREALRARAHVPDPEACVHLLAGLVVLREEPPPSRGPGEVTRVARWIEARDLGAVVEVEDAEAALVADGEAREGGIGDDRRREAGRALDHPLAHEVRQGEARDRLVA